MTALRGLKLVFPVDVNPLYAGFGSSVSDMVAYKKARLCDVTFMNRREDGMGYCEYLGGKKMEMVGIPLFCGLLSCFAGILPILR